MPRYDDDEDDRPRSRRQRDREEFDDEDDEYDDRPRRRSRRREPEGNPAAGVSLTLGLLSIMLNVITGIPAIVFGIIGLKNSGRNGTGKEMAIAGIGSAVLCTGISCVIIYFLYNAGSGRQADNRTFNNVKHIGLSFHNHHDAHNRFPGAYTTRPGAFFGNQPAPMDQRLTSWRTNLLPYLEQDNLFRQYDQNQPWNGARNQAVTGAFVPSFADGNLKTNQTRFRVFTGPNTPFKHGQPPVGFMAMTDGTSNTILMAESAELGPWGEPKDMEVSPNAPMPLLGDPAKKLVFILMADGSVRTARAGLDDRTLRLLVDPQDGQVVPFDW